jgi:hypothetical protein
MLIALRAWFGQDEVSHGSERYRVGVDRQVVVPPAVAVYLINNAGFHIVSRTDAELAPPTTLEPVPQNLVRMQHPTSASCSYGGCEYRRDQNGEFLVPAAAIADLLGHGFVPIEPAERRRETSPAMPASATGKPPREPQRGSLAKNEVLQGPML